jgi:hypothetical protein
LCGGKRLILARILLLLVLRQNGCTRKKHRHSRCENWARQLRRTLCCRSQGPSNRRCPGRRPLCGHPFHSHDVLFPSICGFDPTYAFYAQLCTTSGRHNLFHESRRKAGRLGAATDSRESGSLAGVRAG